MPYKSPNKQEAFEKVAKEMHVKAMYSLTVKPKMKVSTRPQKYNGVSLTDLPVEIVKDIFFKKYLEVLKSELRGWIKEHAHKIELKMLCSNPNIAAMEIIKEANPDDLDWHELSKNPFAIKILSLPANYDRLEWEALSSNKEAVGLLEAELLKDPNDPNNNNINWGSLSGNEKASRMIMQRIAYERWLSETDNAAYKALRINKKIDWGKLYANESHEILNFLLSQPNPEISWYYLSGNTNPIAIQIIENELKRDPNSPNIYWRVLSGNPAAMKILEAELNSTPDSTKIHWNMLSWNTNKRAIRLIEKKMEKMRADNEEIPKDHEYGKNQISWYNLSFNPAAIKLLQKYKEYIMWGALSANPAIFHLDLWNTRRSSSKSSSSPRPAKSKT